MPMALHTKACEDYYEVCLEGVYTLHEMLLFVPQGIQYARREGFWYVLYDCTALRGDIPLIDFYTLGHSLAKQIHQLSSHLRVAWLGASQHIADRFLETVTYNAGAMVRVTTQREDARTWLHHLSAKPLLCSKVGLQASRNGTFTPVNRYPSEPQRVR